MGAIMCMGVATANSISSSKFSPRNNFAKHGSSIESGARGGFHPFSSGMLMTALAMIIGMIPMALGLGRRRRNKMHRWAEPLLAGLLLRGP